MLRRVGLPVLLIALAACASGSNVLVRSPERFTHDVGGYAENASGFPPDIAYGWHLDVTGGVARWRECSSAVTCGDIERERPTMDVLATEPVGRTTLANAGEVEVLRLTLRSRRRNVMPQSP